MYFICIVCILLFAANGVINDDYYYILVFADNNKLKIDNRPKIT